MKKDKIAIIGTGVSASVVAEMASKFPDSEVVVLSPDDVSTTKVPKDIRDIPFKIEPLQVMTYPGHYLSGRDKRRERRKLERNKWKKKK